MSMLQPVDTRFASELKSAHPADTTGKDSWRVEAAGHSLRFTTNAARLFLLRREPGGTFVLPLSCEAQEEQDVSIGHDLVWLLPKAGAEGGAWMLRAEGSCGIEIKQGIETEIIFAEGPVHIRRWNGRPNADAFGGEIKLDFEDGQALQEAWAGFYWDTMMPCVAERTLARNCNEADGYVLSTLELSRYAGTYPDVDHEFQIKGRVLLGNPLDSGLCRRMIELQLRLMEEDPAGLWRLPCAVQLDGSREYHVRRSSMDGSENAEMFLMTGNIAVIESAWLHVAMTDDIDWLGTHIEALERALSIVRSFIDSDGRLWSDVYYEDQVIKDGRVALAQAFAINAFDLLADLECRLGRLEKSADCHDLSKRLRKTLCADLPEGYWDPSNWRFVDWVDRHGCPHDHIHLLANILPVHFGYASEDQARSIRALIAAEWEEFQRFPTFNAARIGDYTDSEIGTGGPYDLCAAGRYWCWDAAFLASEGRGHAVRHQLLTVAAEARKDGYLMGERYDMDHVYYIDGKTWHGAGHYYEYPCVFSWVLLHDYLGICPSLDADLCLRPAGLDPGETVLDISAIRLAWTWRDGAMHLRNLADRPRRIQLDFSRMGISPGTLPELVEIASHEAILIDTNTNETAE